MNEWLDIMLGEISRKTDEEKSAVEERLRRARAAREQQPAAGGQDKAVSGKPSK